MYLDTKLQMQIQAIGAERLHRADTGREHVRELCGDGTLGGRAGQILQSFHNLIVPSSTSPLTYS